MRENIGPAFAAFTMGLAVQGNLAVGGAQGFSTPEASGTALAPQDSDNAMGLPPAFPNQRTEFIGKSPTELYVPATNQNGFLPPRARQYRKYGLVYMNRW